MPEFDHPACDLLQLRVAALGSSDFGLIYDTSHPDSLFRQQFPLRSEYLEFAAEQIAGRISISGFQLLQLEPATEQVRVIFRQQLVTPGETQETLECALLLRHHDQWLYHSSQKLLIAELPLPPEQVDFAFFDRAVDKIVF